MVVAALGSSWATVDEDTASQITSQFIKILGDIVMRQLSGFYWMGSDQAAQYLLFSCSIQKCQQGMTAIWHFYSFQKRNVKDLGKRKSNFLSFLNVNSQKFEDVNSVTRKKSQNV